MTATTTEWVTVKKQWCHLLGDEAELLEHRAYPAETVPDMEPFRVLGRKCSAALICNLKGCQCKWSYTNPTTDRFNLD